MKARKLLIFLLCFVLLVGALAVVASAKGSTPTESYKEVTNSDGTVTTKYGTIPKTYADSATYPFVHFKYKNGALNGSAVGYDTLENALDAAKSYQDDNKWNKTDKVYTGDVFTSKIILRKNYTTTTADKFNNYAQTMGEVILDLNGYTLTQGTGTTGLFYYVTTKSWGNPDAGGRGVFETEFTIINGNVAVNTAPVFHGNMWDSLYYNAAGESATVAKGGVHSATTHMSEKDFIWNFNNVKFEYVANGTAANMLMAYGDPQSKSDYPPQSVAPFDFNYTDCTFDLTNAPSAVTLFNAAPGSAQFLKSTINVTGCEIIAPAVKTPNLTVSKVETVNGSSVTFNEGANGDVLTLTLTEGEVPATPTSSNYVTVDGKQLYWHSVDGKYVLTECVADAHACSCGTIYTDCTDANSDKVCDECGAKNVGGKWFSEADIVRYPFAILDASGKYVSVQTTWKNATNAAKNKNGYTVVLLRDYTNVASDSNNLKDFKGTLNVDLNGHALTRDYDGAYIFDNWWDSVTVADTVTVNFKNGAIVSEKWVFNFSGNAALAVEKTANINFDNVTFKLASNNDKAGGWLFEVHSQEYDQKITANITFNECTFDTTAKATNSNPAFNLDIKNKAGVDYVKANVTFNGGKYVANNFKTNVFYQIHSDDTITFNKGENGEYLTLELKNGKTPNTPAAADYLTVNGTKMYFHKDGSVYTLSACLDSATHHKCTCGFVFSADCTDANKDHSCDICGAKSDCIDDNKDHVCDLCDKVYTCAEADFNKDHVCDFCGETFACTDANKDELCDHCGYVMNDYGIKNIDPKYADVEKYPFFVLKLENGVYTFQHAASQFYGNQAGTSAIGYAIYNTLEDNNKYDIASGTWGTEGNAKGVVTAIVVMRRDYTMKMGNDSATEHHDNIAHTQGHLIVDLGGNTLTEAAGSNKAMFTVTVKGWTGAVDKVYTFPSTYTFKNGNVKVLKYAFASVGTNDAVESNAGYNIANSVMNVNFENVNFGLAAGATTTTLAYATGSATNKYPGIAKVNVTFTGCTFDFKTVVPTTATTIINNNTTGKDVDADIVVNGCEILASDMSKVTVCQSSTTNGTSTVFKKDTNGNYITLKMPAGSVAPATNNTVTLDSGIICSLVKASSVNGEDVYKVYPTVMVGYKIKTSVTLYSNFVYNIYIPTANFNKATVNGNAVTYKEVEIDGVSYYHVVVNLAAAESLSDIALSVTLNSGDTTTAANWTLSVVKYTKSVIDGNYDEITKILMKDMLVYATAAHTYFENELDSAKAAEVEALLAGYSAALPTGEAKTPANSTYFKEIAVNVGEVPSFRFYLQTGYSIADFDFTAGGKAVNAVEGTDDRGAYLEVAMFAYMMLDDVTYTVKANGEIGTYNLYSYYNYASAFNIENLTAIVEGLMKYSVSADNYREYVVNNTCYHDYAEGKCTKCGEDDPDVGTMSINAPASIYSNYAGKDISVTFSKSWYKGEVTWSTNNPNVKVENGKIYATGSYDVFPSGTSTAVTVTATTKDHTASVVVNVSVFRSSAVDVEKKVQYYENNIIKPENKGGMIFLGDSYFDGVLNSSTGMPPFWNDFYQDWAGEKAFLMGMSSSQIGELEVASERIVYPMQPSEIVIHIGHNDMHSGTISPEDFVARLTALVNEYHAKLPNAKIYVLSVDPKKAANDSTQTNYETRYHNSFVKVPAVNAAVEELAENTEWLTYVDTTYIFYGVGGTNVNTNMYPQKDGSHPTLYAYDLMRYTINKARGVDVVGGQVMDADNHVTNITNEGMFFTDNNGQTITSATGDFVISGKLAITDMLKGNSHIQFRFVSGKRFLLHDSDGDGIFFANGKTKSSEKFDANNGLVLEWAVVVKGTVASFYVNGKLETTLDVPTIENFNVGVMDADVTVFDVKFSASTDADYSTHMEKYSEANVYVEKYGNSEKISESGVTYDKDTNGNTLAGSNFVVKGKLQVYATNFSNPHIQFSFGNGYRFLIWDSDSDGLFGAGYRKDEDGSLIKDTATGEIYQAAKGGNLSLEWAVVVEDGKAYFYINGILKATMTEDAANAPFSTFNIGALQMNVLFYDIEIYAENGNADKYNAAVAEYK